MARISEKTVKDIDGREEVYPQIVTLARLLARSAAQAYFQQSVNEGNDREEVDDNA